MPDSPPPESSILLYQTEDGRTRIQCRFENETIWLTQALIAELFQVSVPTVNEHLKGVFAEGELAPDATIRKFRIVRSEGRRQVTREVEHYNLPAILAVGYRVRSHRGTQSRQWPTARLSESLVKGFTRDDERLKNPATKGPEELRRRAARANPGHPLLGSRLLPEDLALTDCRWILPAGSAADTVRLYGTHGGQGRCFSIVNGVF